MAIFILWVAKCSASLPASHAGKGRARIRRNQLPTFREYAALPLRTGPAGLRPEKKKKVSGQAGFARCAARPRRGCAYLATRIYAGRQ